MADALAAPSSALLAVAFGVFVRPPALVIAGVLAGCELATGEYAIIIVIVCAATADLDICLESFLLLRSATLVVAQDHFNG